MPRIQPEHTRRTQGKRQLAWAVQDNTLKGPWAFKAKEKVICMCEGPGKVCRFENPSKQAGSNAIPGLHSSWVGKQQQALAMARPWQEHIQRYHIVDAFQRHNIGMVLNLQELGEHSACGPGNLPDSGFTYSPETFMAAGIGYYNMSWADMGVPTLGRMMDIVQVMDYVVKVEKRKVAVHCHAGLGRTGLSIACHLVYSEGMVAKRAVEEVRHGRPGALQTRKQVRFVYVFEQYLAYLRRVMPEPSKSKKHVKRDVELPQPAEASTSADPGSATPDAAAPPREKSQSYPCGLTIVRASAPQGSSLNQVKRTRRPAVSAAEQAADPAIPWNVETLDIIPDKYERKWQPHAPRTYQEALRRQQQLLHGHTRSTFMHLHRFVAELALHIIKAAQAHGSCAPAPPTASRATPVSVSTHAANSLPSQVQLPHQPQLPAAPYPVPPVMAAGHPAEAALPAELSAPPALQQVAAVAEGLEQQPRKPHVTAPSARGQFHGTCWTRAEVCIDVHSTQGPVSESTQPAQHQGPVTSFADALLRCTHGHWQAEQISQLRSSPAYASFAGQLQVDPASQAAAQNHIRDAANFGNYEALATAPIVSLVHAIEEFMLLLTTYVPALSKATLVCIRDCYMDLPYAVGAGPEVEQFAAAQKLLEPIPPEDQELLLLFSALLRHVTAASGAGCEEQVVGLCQWVVQLLMGAQLQYAKPQALEAVNSFLWYLLKNDVAYASLILARHKRQAGRTRKQAGVKQPEPARVSQSQVPAGRLPSLPAIPARLEAMSLSNLDDMLAKCQPGGAQQSAASAHKLPAPLPPMPPHTPLNIKELAAPPLPPAQYPPAKALSPARPGPNVLWQAGNMAVPGQVLGGDVLAGVAHVQGIIMSKGPQGEPDPRLYGGGQYDAGREVPSNPYAGLKEQLAGIPTAYFPPTTPGQQQVVVHDVWI